MLGILDYASPVRREERTWARAFFKDFYPSAGPGEFENWLSYVTAIDVDLFPGGRAVLRHPAVPIPVELRWDATGVYSVVFGGIPGEVLPRMEVGVSPYVAALELKRRSATTTAVEGGSIVLSGSGLPTMRASGVARLPDRPAPGKPPPLGFYTQMLDLYDALVSGGVRSPVDEIARRYKVQPGTVKSWLHRGRAYQGREDLEG